MYKKYKYKQNQNCDVIYESLVEGGFFDNITNIVGGIMNNTNSPLTNLGQNMLRNFNQTSEIQPQYIRNPGISIPKTTYSQMKSTLLSQGQIFWDSEFPANRIELTPMNKVVEWKRPFEICQNPQMFTSGVSRFDINQGKLGDCWLLAALASLIIFRDLFIRVVPYDQSFNQGDYCGMFRFYIWYYGQWLEIIVDDLLPTVNGKLVYMTSTDSNEFWSPLLEKAYAKIYGSYKNLKGGCTSDAMVDFTGGITEKITLRKNLGLINDNYKINELFFLVLNAYSNQALMSCSKEGGLEFRDNSGLVSRHAYSITAVCVVNTYNVGQVYLIRLRNPWGNETEWKGPWCDGSHEWQWIPPQELQRLQIVRREDGEFWMSFYDFVNNFDKLEICHIEPQSMEDLGQLKNKENKMKKNWELKMFYGDWRIGISAGGCSNNKTFSMNPQFELIVTEPDSGSTDGKGTVIVGLMQRNLRMFNRELHAIAYSIYAKPKGINGRLSDQYIGSLAEVASSGTYINLREVTGRHKLFPGTYIIVPSTFKPNEEGQFLIRIFSVAKTSKMSLS